MGLIHREGEVFRKHGYLHEAIMYLRLKSSEIQN